MSKKDKVLRQKLVSVKGVAVYPRLNKPDTKFDAKGVYKTVLRVSEEDAASMIKKIETFAEEAAEHHGKKMKNLPFEHESDDNGKPTGNILFKYKVKAQWPDGSSRKPALVDGRKQELPKDAIVGGGSVIRISGEMESYEGFGGGVTIKPVAVQVLELKTFNKGVDDFDVEEDNFGDSEGGDSADGDEPEF